MYLWYCSVRCGDREGDPTFGAGRGLVFPWETVAGIATSDDITAELRPSFRLSLLSLSLLWPSSMTVGLASLKVDGVKLGNSSWMKFGKNVLILVHVILQSCCFGDSTSDWLLGVIKLSKMPWVDITSNMFFRDSGMASYWRDGGGGREREREREGEREGGARKWILNFIQCVILESYQ